MKKSAQGFTLVELLVVIAIIAILAAVVVLIINPLELTKRGRDAARLSDLANLQSAINVAVQEGPGGNTVLCDGAASGTCNGASGGTGGNVLGRASDGSGWVVMNLTAAQQAISVPTLPADPLNDATYHYAYCGDVDAGTWEINAVLESAQQDDKMITDGGPDSVQNVTGTAGRYEIGTDLGLMTSTSTACTY